ncbi:MAG: hypothetical protein Q4C37_03760 [Bacteroidales bacterium]|nr:hypothetical protein [Bacteroidales bacterium]
MMTKATHIKDLLRVMRTLLLLAAVSATASCDSLIYDYYDNCDEAEQQPAGDGRIAIDMQIHTPANRREMPTRGVVLDDDRENRINEVSVMLFTADGNGRPDRYVETLHSYYLRPDEADPTLYYAGFVTKVTQAIKNKELKICIMANADAMLAEVEQAAASGATLTYSKIRELMTTRLATDGSDPAEIHTPLTPEDTEAPFVMWGMPNMVIKTANGAQFSVESCLMRSLARFDIDLHEDLRKSGLFDFRSVYFYRPSTSIMQLPETAKISGTHDETGHPYYYAISPSLAADNDRFYRWDYPESVNDGVFEYSCYVPEGDVLMKGINGGPGHLRDVNHAQRPALVVGGYYNGGSEMSYYRIDICNADGNLIDILRNHQYTITIKSVLGPGEPTPDEAYDNNNIKIVAEITDWCLVENDVMYQGSDWVSVSRRNINLTGSAGVGNTFIINSSVPIDQWEFRLGEEGEFTKAQLMESDNFFVTRPILEKGARILVVTKHELGAGKEPVSERLYVRIGGRVLFHITITQWPLEDDYWFFSDMFIGNSGPWETVITFPIGGADPNIPPGSFIDFIRWLFGGEYSGSVGEGDNHSPSEYLDYYFWKFISWFFTDEYGHVIGGTPEDWDEAWTNPVGLIIFDFMSWMLGPDFYKEITGPGTGPYDPDNPDFTTLGAKTVYEFLQWLQSTDFDSILDNSGHNPDSGDISVVIGKIETIVDFMKWYVGTVYQRWLGSDPDNPTNPDYPDVMPDDKDTGDDSWKNPGSIDKNLGEDDEEPENPDKPDEPAIKPDELDHDGNWNDGGEFNTDHLGEPEPDE